MPFITGDSTYCVLSCMACSWSVHVPDEDCVMRVFTRVAAAPAILQMHWVDQHLDKWIVSMMSEPRDTLRA